MITVVTQTFRVYTKGSTGPVLLLLHGGGHSALSWACFTVSVMNNSDNNCFNQLI